MALTPTGSTGSQAPEDAEPGTCWQAVAALMAAGVVAAVQIGKASAALPVLQDEFDLGPTAAAWFLSVVSAIGAVAGALLGSLGQRLGFRRQVLLGLVAIAVSSAAGAQAESAGWLLTARAGEGLGFVLVVLAVPALLSEMSARAHRRLVTGAWGAHMPAGAGVATLLVPLLVPGIGWRGAWLVAAGLTAAALLAVARWVPRTHEPGRSVVVGLVRTARRRGVLSMAVLFLLYSGQYLALVGLLPAVLVNDGGVPLTTAGLVGGLVFLVNAPGALVGAALLYRGTPWLRLVAVGSLAMALTVWGVLHPGLPFALRIAAALAFSFSAGLVPAAIFSGVAAQSAGTPYAGASVGLVQQASSLGQLLGPPLVVAVGGFGTWAAGPAVLCCLASSAVVVAVSCQGQERAEETSPRAG